MIKLMQPLANAVKGYSLFDTMGCTPLKIETPCAGVNLIKNPSFETAQVFGTPNADGFEIQFSGCSPSISENWASYGCYSMQVLPTAVEAQPVGPPLITATLPVTYFEANTVYSFGVDLCPPTGETLRFGLSVFNATTNTLVALVETRTACCGERLCVTWGVGVVPAAGYRIELTQMESGFSAWYNDAWLLTKGECQTYFDGDNDGVWAGAAHGSRSLRDERGATGRLLDLRAMGIVVRGIVGLGASPLTHIGLDPVGIGGKAYQSSRIAQKTFTLILDVSDCVGDYRAIQAQRMALEKAFITIDTVTGRTKPVRFHWSACDTFGTVDCNEILFEARYLSGLEGAFDNLNQDVITVQFEMTEVVPFWKRGAQCKPLCVTPQTITAEDYGNVIARFSPAMGIELLGQATICQLPSNQVTSIEINTNSGVIYAASGGKVFVYNEYLDCWAQLGSNFTGFATINALAVLPFGVIYAVGDFVVNGATNAAFYSPGLGDWQPFANTLDGVINDIFYYNGRWYVVGDFSFPVNKFAYLDGTNNWQPAYGSPQFNAGISAAAIDAGGKIIYLGGYFSAPQNRLCMLDPTTGIFYPMESAAAVDTIYDFEALPNGQMVCVGSFPLIGEAITSNVALWTGGLNGSWVGPPHGGLNNSAARRAKYVPGQGTWIIGNFDFTYDGQISLPSGIAVLKDDFSAMSSNFSGSFPELLSLAAHNGRIYIGGNLGSGIESACKTELDYCGTAESQPTLKIIGGGKLWSITNLTTGDALAFTAPIPLLDGETLTVDFEAQSITSDYFGNRLSYVSRESYAAFARFRLIKSECTPDCKAHKISIYMTDLTVNASAKLYYKERHLSADIVGTLTI